MTTNKNEDFEALQCRAETISTVKFHIINITKLSRYNFWLKKYLNLTLKNFDTAPDEGNNFSTSFF